MLECISGTWCAEHNVGFSGRGHFKVLAMAVAGVLLFFGSVNESVFGQCANGRCRPRATTVRRSTTSPGKKVVRRPVSTPRTNSRGTADNRSVANRSAASRSAAASQTGASPSSDLQGKSQASGKVAPVTARPKRPSYRSQAATSGTDRKNIAIDGFSPIALLQDRAWAPGDREFSTVYQGLRYQMVSQAELLQFTEQPEKFAAVLNGDCAVSWIRDGQRKAGSTQFTAIYRDRIYLLADAAAKADFLKTPAQFSADLLDSETGRLIRSPDGGTSNERLPLPRFGAFAGATKEIEKSNEKITNEAKTNTIPSKPLRSFEDIGNEGKFPK